MTDSAGAEDLRVSSDRWAVIPVGLGLAVCSLLFFSWLAEEVLDLRTQQFDQNVRASIHQQASPSATHFMRAVTHLGDWTLVLPAVLLLWAFFLWRGERDHARVLLITMIGAVVLESALKVVFHRARPDPFFINKPASYSFPSGHSLVSLCFYGLLAGMLSLELPKVWQRIGVWTAAAVVVGLIGLSRIYLGVHWPSDVLAGYAAAIVWMGAVRLLVHTDGKSKPRLAR